MRWIRRKMSNERSDPSFHLNNRWSSNDVYSISGSLIRFLWLNKRNRFSPSCRTTKIIFKKSMKIVSLFLFVKRCIIELKVRYIQIKKYHLSLQGKFRTLTLSVNSSGDETIYLDKPHNRERSTVYIRQTIDRRENWFIFIEKNKQFWFSWASLLF